MEWLRTEGKWILDEHSRRIALRGGDFDYYRAELDPGEYDPKATILRLKAKGMNVARLAFDIPESQFVELTDFDFTLMDALLNWMEAQEIYAILDCHIDNIVEVKAAWIARWVDIATHYRDRSVVAAYGLANEPMPNETAIPEIRQALLDCLSAIRTVDTKHVCVLPAAYGAGWGFLSDTWRSEDIRPNCVYSIQMWTLPYARFQGNDYAEAQAYSIWQLDCAVKFRESRNAPVWIQEIGTSGERQQPVDLWRVKNLIQQLEEQCIGYGNWLVHAKWTMYPNWDYLYPEPFASPYYTWTPLGWPPLNLRDWITDMAGIDQEIGPCLMRMWDASDYMTFKPGPTLEIKIWNGEPYYPETKARYKETRKITEETRISPADYADLGIANPNTEVILYEVPPTPISPLNVVSVASALTAGAVTYAASGSPTLSVLMAVFWGLGGAALIRVRSAPKGLSWPEGLVCQECGALLKVPEGTPPGSEVICPRCEAVYETTIL